ncbi:hypothetical protein Q4Q35_03980 [Flavivirga aquimarina]|uniref:Uncharacterized protein n=1 Tax=Flavivirga aquimarina TaxID=2027862 RepID=A0ABT8W759_9FLAO|nr:hypothetical protein [Flavivirga aquimarina]MDO5968957.1 hypothetical protein [Flavivirga aquimarina]
MNLQHWFTLEMLHEYFDNNVCTVFKLIPMVSTQRVMKNYNIHINKLKNQYLGYIGVSPSTNSWEELQTIDDLYFQLINTDQEFDNYTDLALPKEEGTLLYLTNPLQDANEQAIITNRYLPVQSLFFQVKVPQGQPVSVVIKNSKGEDVFNQLTIENQPSISININVFGTGVYELWIAGKLSQTFIGTSEKIEDKCYGILHLQMASILAALKENNPPLLKANFIARSTYWQYAVVVSQDKKITIQDISIESVNDEQYSGPVKKTIGTEEANLFTSPDIIKLHQRARASPLLKMLYKNDFSDTVMELDIKMPVPKPSVIITKKENNEDVFYSQTIIHV